MSTHIIAWLQPDKEYHPLDLRHVNNDKITTITYYWDHKQGIFVLLHPSDDTHHHVHNMSEMRRALRQLAPNTIIHDIHIEFFLPQPHNIHVRDGILLLQQPPRNKHLVARYISDQSGGRPKGHYLLPPPCPTPITATNTTPFNDIIAQHLPPLVAHYAPYRQLSHITFYRDHPTYVYTPSNDECVTLFIEYHFNNQHLRRNISLYLYKDCVHQKLSLPNAYTPDMVQKQYNTIMGHIEQQTFTPPPNISHHTHMEHIRQIQHILRHYDTLIPPMLMELDRIVDQYYPLKK